MYFSKWVVRIWFCFSIIVFWIVKILNYLHRVIFDQCLIRKWINIFKCTFSKIEVFFEKGHINISLNEFSMSYFVHLIMGTDGFCGKQKRIQNQTLRELCEANWNAHPWAQLICSCAFNFDDPLTYKKKRSMELFLCLVKIEI